MDYYSGEHEAVPESVNRVELEAFFGITETLRAHSGATAFSEDMSTTLAERESA